LPWLASVPSGVGFGDGEAEFFEFSDQLAHAAVIVEPGSVVGELVVGQDASGVLAVLLADPGNPLEAWTLTVSGFV